MEAIGQLQQVFDFWVDAIGRVVTEKGWRMDAIGELQKELDFGIDAIGRVGTE